VQGTGIYDELLNRAYKEGGIKTTKFKQFPETFNTIQSNDDSKKIRGVFIEYRLSLIVKKNHLT